MSTSSIFAFLYPTLKELFCFNWLSKNKRCFFLKVDTFTREESEGAPIRKETQTIRVIRPQGGSKHRAHRGGGDTHDVIQRLSDVTRKECMDSATREGESSQAESDAFSQRKTRGPHAHMTQLLIVKGFHLSVRNDWINLTQSGLCFRPQYEMVYLLNKREDDLIPATITSSFRLNEKRLRTRINRK